MTNDTQNIKDLTMENIGEDHPLNRLKRKKTDEEDNSPPPAKTSPDFDNYTKRISGESMGNIYMNDYRKRFGDSSDNWPGQVPLRPGNPAEQDLSSTVDLKRKSK